MKALIEKLAKNHRLTLNEYQFLIENRTRESAQMLAQLAVAERKKVYGTDVYIRGLIEIGNVCKNDCLYCGIRRSSRNCQRYQLTPLDILECCKEGYQLGFRTFVLQGGENPAMDDKTLCEIVASVKATHPDCAVTLSLGERSRESYKLLRQAGADRYLLRHETADPDHYALLHPEKMSFENRMRCLMELKELGYQVGCGFMVESPYQTVAHLAKDLKFIEEFKPEMCGIGPFVPHSDTPFGVEKPGTVELTCYLLSIIRLIRPDILLPATTALGTIDPNGREKGILSGANVVMPNLSPSAVRKKYMLYNNKVSDGAEAAECLDNLRQRMASIGYQIPVSRGDHISRKEDR